MSDEEAWLELACVLSCTVRKVNGRLSAVMAALVRLCFSPEGHSLQAAGMTLDLHGGSAIRLFLPFGVCIADEAALHMVFMCKGSGGLKPCMRCQNISNERTSRDCVERGMTGFCQYHTCSDPTKLVLHTPRTIRLISERLTGAVATGMTKRRL